MRLLMILFLLAACGASPAPEFGRAKRVDVQRGGRAYTIFYTNRRVEVIRLGRAHAGEHQDIRQTMMDLIPQVTGCRLSEPSLTGDSGEMRGSIFCKK